MNLAKETAASIINTSSEERLIDILKSFGEEPKAKNCTRNCVGPAYPNHIQLVKVVETIYGHRREDSPGDSYFSSVPHSGQQRVRTGFSNLAALTGFTQ